MQFVISSDYHGDWVTGGYERHDEVCAAGDQVAEYAIRRKVDRFLFLGDLTDPDVNLPLAHRTIAWSVELYRKLQSHDIDSDWIVGNHDVVEDGQGSHTLMALEKAGATVHARPRLHKYTDRDGREIGLATLPYPSMTDRYDPEAFIRKEATQFCGDYGIDRMIVAGHMTKIPGLAPGSESAEMARGRDMWLPVEAAAALPGVVILNGHYHRQYAMRRTERDVLIPGSLVRCTHGEEDHRPGFLFLEV